MSLSAWEQQALDSIKDGLTGSDPQLAVLLTTFTRLAADEEMPIREEILPGTRQTILSKPRRRASVRRRSRRMRRGLAVQWVLLLLWLVITVALITIALVFSQDGGQGTCTGSWASVCSRSVPG
jgi:Protein of unknown function (DUF3040)